MESIDPKKVYIETSKKSLKSLLQFCSEVDRNIQKDIEKAGKRKVKQSIKSKEIGSKVYNDKIICLSCKKDTMNRQPVRYFQSSSENGSSKYSIKAVCSECGKAKSKFIKMSDVPKDFNLKKNSSRK